jgi:hypothetical protein
MRHWIYHWTYAELKNTFGYDPERFIRDGGYPGSVTYED